MAQTLNSETLNPRIPVMTFKRWNPKPSPEAQSQVKTSGRIWGLCIRPKRPRMSPRTRSWVKGLGSRGLRFRIRGSLGPCVHYPKLASLPIRVSNRYSLNNNYSNWGIPKLSFPLWGSSTLSPKPSTQNFSWQRRMGGPLLSTETCPTKSSTSKLLIPPPNPSKPSTPMP